MHTCEMLIAELTRPVSLSSFCSKMVFVLCGVVGFSSLSEESGELDSIASKLKSPEQSTLYKWCVFQRRKFTYERASICFALRSCSLQTLTWVKYINITLQKSLIGTDTYLSLNGLMIEVSFWLRNVCRLQMPVSFSNLATLFLSKNSSTSSVIYSIYFS